ncbi:MAG: hypothetical protein FD181_2594 [Prolixibacteraceae bacterium]|nr:MAG: hypothetical protein FD181_2594 [Prolixibacteraceae bacterium]
MADTKQFYNQLKTVVSKRIVDNKKAPDIFIGQLNE